jgi:hypothetical protein
MKYNQKKYNILAKNYREGCKKILPIWYNIYTFITATGTRHNYPP